MIDHSIELVISRRNMWTAYVVHLWSMVSPIPNNIVYVEKSLTVIK